ncbi:MAG TPA: 4-(cytidine 5'-diphospho)-2-C-methyl-D-erythritol kinase [Candidatus Baltobacteraceae bacterium]|nr:4-(cytidine 5'-diphospho)-2-C-methyl-D-erythritol kinase [Candidatus Baltobacteraceae bacterium]
MKQPEYGTIKTMKYLCPAKINLTLEVLQRRPDGYHALRSVMVPIGLYDELTVEPADEFSFMCNDPHLSSSDNLVVRAALAIDSNARVAVSLLKRIPVQAGLGGGSSDAAALIRLAIEGAFGRSYQHDWLALAHSLGSDVPFFLAGSGALVEGTGERVTAAGALPPWHVLVIKPPASLSTAAAYAELSRRERPGRPRNTSRSLAMTTALQRADFGEVETLLDNDFHALALQSTPDVVATVQALHRAGAPHALLSGSGSAVFTLAKTKVAIAAIAEKLELPSTFARFAVPFASTPLWRGESG